MVLKSFRFSLVSRLSIMMAAGALLSACNSAGTNQVDNTLDVTPSANQQLASVPPEDQFQDPRGYCPKTVLRGGTEAYDVFPTGVKKEDEGSSAKLRFRATISEIVRECNTAGDFLNIRVGVRGRYLSGPAGESGSFMMPVRVAVTQGESVLYSQLHQIPADIPPGQRNGTFQYVDNNISIPKPDRENIIIYVGYDEGPYENP